MPLVTARTVPKNRCINYDSPIAAKIQQRRYQLLVHSLLYYELDMSIVTDSQWAEWGKELVELQNAHPDISEKVIFAEAFKNFDPSTGYDLPYHDEQIINIAYRLLCQETSAEKEEALHKLQYEVPRVPAEYDRYKKSNSSTTTPRKEGKRVEQKPRKGLFSIART